MSRISDAFAKEKAFIPFITGGDPDIETSYELIKAMAKSGADISRSEFHFQIRLQKDRLFRKQIFGRLVQVQRQMHYLIWSQACEKRLTHHSYL